MSHPGSPSSLTCPGCVRCPSSMWITICNICWFGSQSPVWCLNTLRAEILSCSSLHTVSSTVPGPYKVGRGSIDGWMDNDFEILDNEFYCVGWSSSNQPWPPECGDNHNVGLCTIFKTSQCPLHMTHKNNPCPLTKMSTCIVSGWNSINPLWWPKFFLFISWRTEGIIGC